MTSPAIQLTRIYLIMQMIYDYFNLYLIDFFHVTHASTISLMSKQLHLSLDFVHNCLVN